MGKFKVQKQVEPRRKQPGVGRVWETVAKGKRQAVAERLAQYARQDLRHQRPQETRTAQVRITK